MRVLPQAIHIESPEKPYPNPNLVKKGDDIILRLRFPEYPNPIGFTCKVISISSNEGSGKARILEFRGDGPFRWHPEPSKQKPVLKIIGTSPEDFVQYIGKLIKFDISDIQDHRLEI